jgi:short-subunit dehydrogenase
MDADKPRKNVVITGSTRGIGLEMAKQFLLRGCCVTISGRGLELSPVTKKLLDDFQDKYMYVPCNVQKKAELQILWDVSAAKWGKIDIWINNAGQNTPHVFSWETEENITRQIVETNITGMILGSQIAASGMLKQGSGAIYSMEGLGSNDMIQEKTIHYGMTKRALTYYMKGLAKELKGSGVIAGRLSPGMMLTDFITKDHEGKPAEVVTNESFRKVFNILADRPETVAAYLVPGMLSNKKNDAHIVWLTGFKAALRFMKAPFSKRKLI